MQATRVRTGKKNTVFTSPVDDFRFELPEPEFFVLKTGRKYTDKQLSSIDAANEGWRIETNADGDFEIMPSPFPETSLKNNEVNFQITAWSKKNKTGVVFESSAKFTLPNGAKRMPDAAWILKDRYYALSEKERIKTFARIAPDFVIEFRSDSDRLPILKKKMQEYVENGVRLGWLIDPTEKRVYIYRENGSIEVLDKPKSIPGEVPLRGFTLDLTEIW
jgi:Uma2 family endonuclease